MKDSLVPFWLNEECHFRSVGMYVSQPWTVKALRPPPSNDRATGFAPSAKPWTLASGAPASSARPSAQGSGAASLQSFWPLSLVGFHHFGPPFVGQNYCIYGMSKCQPVVSFFPGRRVNGSVDTWLIDRGAATVPEVTCFQALHQISPSHRHGSQYYVADIVSSETF